MAKQRQSEKKKTLTDDVPKRKLAVAVTGTVTSGRLEINDVNAPLRGSGGTFKSTIELGDGATSVKIAWGFRGINGTKVDVVATVGKKEVLKESGRITDGGYGDSKTVNLPEGTE